MSFPFSVVAVCTSATRVPFNLLSWAVGCQDFGGDSFSVPLSADGKDPASHYGCHGWAPLPFKTMVEDAQGGTLPDIVWEDFSLTEAEVTTLIGVLTISISTTVVRRPHFDQVLTTESLQEIRSGLI